MLTTRVLRDQSEADQRKSELDALRQELTTTQGQAQKLNAALQEWESSCEEWNSWYDQFEEENQREAAEEAAAVSRSRPPRPAARQAVPPWAEWPDQPANTGRQSGPAMTGTLEGMPGAGMRTPQPAPQSFGPPVRDSADQRLDALIAAERARRMQEQRFVASRKAAPGLDPPGHPRLPCNVLQLWNTTHAAEGP